MISDSVPVEMLRCGTSDSGAQCGQPVGVVLVVDDEATYVCDGGHHRARQRAEQNVAHGRSAQSHVCGHPRQVTMNVPGCSGAARRDR